VARAILSYVGRPVRLWRGGRWQRGHGWQEMRKEKMEAGPFALGRRRVFLVDVPDHDLLPDMLPGRPAVAFRAGNGLGFQMWALWLASWPVRWGWLRSLSGAVGWLLPLQRFTAGLDGDRSGMTVAVTGRRGAEKVARRWTLVAVDGEGPEIPTLAAALLAEDIFAGRLRAGAYDSSALLPLDRFDDVFAGLALAHRIEERVLPLGPPGADS
jgi:hypothetical protein